MHDPPFLCAFFDTVGLACEGLAVIRTSAPRLRFIASTGQNAELHQAVGRSPVLRGFENFSFQTKPPAKPTNGGSAAPEVSRPMEHLSCSSVEAGRDASPAICWSGGSGPRETRCMHSHLPMVLQWCSRRLNHRLRENDSRWVVMPNWLRFLSSP